MPSRATCASTVRASCRRLLLAPAPGFPFRRRLLQRDPRLFLHRGKDDGGVRARHAGDAAKGIADEPIERFRVPRDDLEEIGIEARYPMALEHLGQIEDPAGEGLVVAGMGD